MTYQFPTIIHIDQVKKAIQDRSEFIVAEREGYTIINYMMADSDTFPLVTGEDEAILRECRGLVFSESGRVVARRYHKFFNINEREETELKNIDWSRSFVILEKLDGSMITPIPFYDEDCSTINHVRYGTKMGVTEVAMNAEEFVAKVGPVYDDFCKSMLEFGWTPIFEWCSRKNRIVIDYEFDDLVLTGMRDTYYGNYMDYDRMVCLADHWNIPIVQAYEGTFDGIEKFLAEVKTLEDAEGYVIRFDDGHMLKTKGEWYVAIHRAKDQIGLEKNVVSSIVNERIDDVKPFLLHDDRVKLEEFEDKFWKGLNQTAFNLTEAFACCSDLSRKDFAIKFASKQDPLFKTVLFKLYDGELAVTAILNIIKKNCGSQTGIDKVRELWDGHVWEF
ncbi:MAG: RNA ligase [Legionella sp.]|uniref:RNA ligase n=1 Tax=Legionella sp. TaxID=459 RepID=UPI00283D4714|nr:RNA ligase [Legionella sp.]